MTAPGCRFLDSKNPKTLRDAGFAGLPGEERPYSVADMRTILFPRLGDRANAASTLGRFGPGAAAAVPALVDALDDEEYSMRLQAVRALGKIGPAAEAAIPALQAIQDEGRIGSLAKQALEKITGK